jgi:AcrR family transcriptional regulator
VVTVAEWAEGDNTRGAGAERRYLAYHFKEAQAIWEADMGAPRGDAAVTRQAILTAARELFAAHGVDGVSVRRVAAAAGVNHALVHRYFGTKSEMVAAILLAEGEAMSAMGRPEADAGTSLGALRDVLTHALSDGRTSLLLMLRAEIDGLAPESLVAGAPLRPLHLLERWLAARAPDGVEIDHQALAMVIGAAMLGLASCQPMLAAGVELEGDDPDAVLRRCVDLLVGIAAVAIDAGPEALGGTHDGLEKDGAPHRS